MFDTMIDDMDLFDNDLFDEDDNTITDTELVSDDEIENLILNDNPYAYMDDPYAHME